MRGIFGRAYNRNIFLGQQTDGSMTEEGYNRGGGGGAYKRQFTVSELAHCSFISGILFPQYYFTLFQ